MLDTCPHCGKKLVEGKCDNCGYQEKSVLQSMPMTFSSGGSRVFSSDEQRRAFFWRLKVTGRYDPSYSRSSISRIRTTITPARTFGVAKAIIGVTNPPIAKTIGLGETAYKGFKEVSDAVTDAKKIWEKNGDVSQILDRFGEAGTNIAKEGMKQMLSGVITPTLVKTLDDAGVFTNIENATGIENTGNICRELLKLAVDKEISRAFGDAS
jgi:hypothetical protein